MNPLERLEALGFPDAAIVGLPMRGKIVVRVRSPKGWHYEKFDPDKPSEIDTWAAKIMKPRAARIPPRSGAK